MLNLYDYLIIKYLKQVKKKIRLDDKDEFIYVNEEREDPEIMDPSKLTPLSSKKLWKIKHGYKLKKINKR